MAMGIFVCTPLFDALILDKLTETGEQSSVTAREKLFIAATEMFEKHPLLGVGIEQFGFHQPGMEGWGKINGVDVKLGVIKTIPNDVYIELVSEFGLIGTGFFLAYLIPVFWLTNKCPYRSLQAGSYVILAAWLASPSFSLMYYWAFWGLACGLARHAQAQSDPLLFREPATAV
jgi:O-antigen ligase